MKEVNAERIFFLCDGEVETCKKRSCYKNGGECKHTSDIRHAKNFHKENNSPYSAFYENEAAPGDQKCEMRENENNALEIVQLINAIVDKGYENIKGQGKILEGIEKLHQQIRFEEPYLAEYIKKRMICRAKEKGDLQ